MTTIKDEMVNDWGCTLIQERNEFGRSSKTTINLDTEVGRSVPGFKLEALVHSGSCANNHAVAAATDGDFSRCLVPMGSYVVGDEGPLQALSSSSFDFSRLLCTIVSPSDMNQRGESSKQIVAFPYFVNHDKIDEKKLEDVEQKCLHALETKLWMARLQQKKYRTILIEPILSGNGGELSHNFLIGLSEVLKTFSISIVLDEIMTCGRVGPKMTMYEGLPREFQELVAYITVGKIFGCGIVLDRRPDRPQNNDSGGAIRVESTHLAAGEPCLKWQYIQKKVNDGMIQTRRAQVLQAMGWRENSDQHWGKGCLIFSSKSRPEVTRNLKCRLLPMLETDVKLKTLSLKDTTYSKSALCDLLLSSAEEWLKQMNEQVYEISSPPFLGFVAQYLTQHKPSMLFIEKVLEEMGEPLATTMADKHTRRNNPKKAKPHPKKAKSYISELLNNIEKVDPNFLEKTRKGKRRLQGYSIQYEGI